MPRPRLPQEEEKLIREMVANTLPTGGFACSIDCIQRMLGEIDTLRDLVARYCDTDRMTREEIRAAVDAAARMEEMAR